MIQKVTTVSAISPVRCGDVGGWLDTWFAKYGNIVNLCVLSRLFGSTGPFRGIKVTVSRRSSKKSLIEVSAADPSYDVSIPTEALLSNEFNHKNLLLATLYLVSQKFPKCFSKSADTILEISSPIPPGASLGTSAAVSVTIIKALCNSTLSRSEIAQLAWRAETEIMGGQSGTQDQFAAAFGNGVNFISIQDFPNTSCEPVEIKPKTRLALEDGLVTIFYGQHDSSSMHIEVIHQLEKETEEAPRLQAFRPLANRAQECLIKNDLAGYGEVMMANTEAQAALAKGIVSNKALSIINLAKLHQTALGWKVNGAGGAGGSITLLFVNRKAAEDFVTHCRGVYSEGSQVYFEHRLC